MFWHAQAIWAQALSSSTLVAFSVFLPAMARGADIVPRKLAAIEAERVKLRTRLMILNAKYRYWKEKERSQVRKAVRDEMKAKAKGKGKKQKSAGRPERWPGKCRQCCHLFFGGTGGVYHHKSLCAATQAWNQ